MESAVRQRLKWVRLYTATGNAGLTWRRCGISRPTLRLWARRFEEHGEAGLEERSRRPKRSPRRKVFQAERSLILSLRRSQNLGARRVQSELRLVHGIELSITSIQKVLDGASVPPLRKPRRSHPPKRHTRPLPGDRVQMDTMKIAPAVYQYTAVDDCSRFRVLGVFPRRTAAYTIEFLTRLSLLSLLSILCAAAWGAHPVGDLKKLSLEQLTNLKVTTVSRQPSTIGQSAAAIHVITQQDIRRSGVTSIPELFRHVPGMNVARVDANKWAVSARGFNDRFANKLLVQMDGRTLYNPIFSGVFWDTVDYTLEDIDRIEVIRGPGASVWGANAVNGVINIITQSSRDTQGALLIGGGGAEEKGFGTLRYGGKIGDGAHYRVYAKGFDRGASFGVSPAPFDDWSGIRGGFRADLQSGDANLVTLQGDYFHSDSERIDFRPQPTAPFLYTNAERELSDGADIQARWTRSLDDGSSWTLQAYWDHIKRRSTGEILVFSMDLFDFDFQHELRSGGRHNIVWGLGFRAMDADLTDSRFGGFILMWDRPHRRSSSPSAFVQDQITLREDRLGLTLGTKIEHNDFTGLELQPTARLLWTPGRDQTVWGAVSRAVRTPTLFEDQRSVTQTPISPAPGITIFPRIVANPALESEEVLAYELGYRIQAAATFSVDTALFYNVYDGLKVFSPRGTSTVGAPAGTTFQLLTHGNRMDGETYGLELAATWNPVDWWQLYGAYSLLRMNLHPDATLPAMSQAVAEAAERQSPEQQLHLQSSWDLANNMELDLMGRFVDSLTGFQRPVDDYLTMDLRFAWTSRDNLMLEIVGHNLLDDHHLEVGGSVLAAPLHELQRSVYAKLTIVW